MAEGFVVGQVYFRAKYAEAGRKYPLLDSFVYVGKNLSDEDQEDTWYFQFADSYAKDGSVIGNRGGDRRVVCLALDQLEEMLDQRRLLVELTAASERRSKQ